MNLYDFEKICELKFGNGDLIWPVFRFDILELRALKIRENRSNYIEKDSKFKIIKNIIQGIFYIKIRRKDILLISPTTFNFKIGSKYKNILYDYYLDALFKHTQLLEEGCNKGWRIPREKTFSSIFPYLIFLAHFLGIIFPTRSNKKDIKVFCENFKNIEYYKVRKVEKKIFWLEKILKVYLKIVKPKLILMNAASYGGYFPILIRVAKELGIKVGEIQHGIISQLDVQYNLNEIERKKMTKYLLDYMLLFGEYWATQLNIGTKNIIVGNPNINNFLMNNSKTKEDIDYLFVSQWMVTDKLINLAVDLRQLLKDVKICFKLHPNEKLHSNQIEKLKKNNIDICSNSKHIYEYLKISKNIIGHSTTTLIEAIAFNKNIYYLKDEFSQNYLPKEIGVPIEMARDILIKKSLKKYKSNYYWENNFLENYLNFLEKEIGIF